MKKGRVKKERKREKKTDIETLFAFVASGAVHVIVKKGRVKKERKREKKTDIETLFAFVASGAVHAM